MSKEKGGRGFGSQGVFQKKHGGGKGSIPDTLQPFHPGGESLLLSLVPDILRVVASVGMDGVVAFVA